MQHGRQAEKVLHEASFGRRQRAHDGASLERDRPISATRNALQRYLGSVVAKCTDTTIGNRGDGNARAVVTKRPHTISGKVQRTPGTVESRRPRLIRSGYGGHARLEAR